MGMNSIEKNEFFRVACAFEAGLGLLAFPLGWLVGIKPMADFIFSWSAIGTGLLGTVPVFILFLVFYEHPAACLVEIKTTLKTVLGPYLSLCDRWQLLLLALLAGVGEELLFRGVFQPWMEVFFGLTAGLFVSNVLFGFVHCVTLLYAVLAGAIGLYLSGLMDVTGQRNLLIPMVTHGVYDFLAFLIVVRDYRAETNI